MLKERGPFHHGRHPEVAQRENATTEFVSVLIICFKVFNSLVVGLVVVVIVIGVESIVIVFVDSIVIVYDTVVINCSIFDCKHSNKDCSPGM